MPLSILTSKYCNSSIWANTCDSCYFSLNSRGLKSYEMQTISAIPGEFSEVMTMARFPHFSRPASTPKMLWFFPRPSA